MAKTLSKAKNTSVLGMEKAGILKTSVGKVRLFLPSELPIDWDLKKDKKFTVWDTTHSLMRLLEKSKLDVAKIMARLGSVAEYARELTYCLYHICEQKKIRQRGTELHTSSELAQDFAYGKRDHSTTRAVTCGDEIT